MVNDLSYVVKGGRLPMWIKRVADFLNIKPIMTTKNNGSMGIAGSIRGDDNFPKKIYKFITKKISIDKTYNISIGHSNTLKTGQNLKEMIEKKHKNINSIYLIDMGCALGVHAGPGALAVAIQPI